jgi:hypothetical protein
MLFQLCKVDWTLKHEFIFRYSNEAVKFKINTYGAHYNDNGIYRKLSLDSNSNCSIIANASGVFDSNGGILESADTGKLFKKFE